MAWHRKAGAADFPFGPVIKVLLACFFIGGAAIGYVYQLNTRNRLLKDLKEREVQLQQLQKEQHRLERERSELYSERRLRQEIQRRGLDLQQPHPTQIVVLYEYPWVPPSSHPLADLREYARREATDETLIRP